MTVVYTKSYSAPPFDRTEILRYAGVRESTAEITELMEECISLATGREAFKACFCKLPVKMCDDGVDLGFVTVNSTDLAKNLKDCDSAVIFAATVGLELDRLVARYSSASPAKALMLQAIGAERIESLCDMLCADISAEYGEVRPRFSAGYGDLPLGLQKDIFALLDCPRKIGLTLNESLLMSPTKSVTAIVGIRRKI